MKTNHPLNLSALICGLTLLPLTVTAQNIITTSTTETDVSYYDDSDYSALQVNGENVVYTGTDITLRATRSAFSDGSTNANGAYITNQATLNLTGGTVSTTGRFGYGIMLTANSSFTGSNVTIRTGNAVGHGVYANSSTLTLTGGTITTGPGEGDLIFNDAYNAYGINLHNNSVGILNNVTIKTTWSSGLGVDVTSSTLTLTGGTITTGGITASGISLYDSTGTLNNVNIETKGNESNGVRAYSSTLTLTGGTITTTGGSNAYGINLTGSSSGAVNDANIATQGLNAYGVNVTGSSTLTLTGGTVSTTGDSGHGIMLTGTSTGTLNNVTIKTTEATSDGVHTDHSTLTLTDSTITTGSNYAYGINLRNNSTGTFNNVTINTIGNGGVGVYADTSTLTLTGGTITAGGNYTRGITLYDSTGNASNVTIETTEEYSHGAFASSSTLAMTGGTITTGGNIAFGISLYDSTSTLNNVTINTTGATSDGVYAEFSSTLTLIDSDISATGNDANAIYVSNESIGTASLGNHNTLTGNILVNTTSTLDLTGSNGTVITGDVTSTDHSTINLTLSGGNTQLIGTGTHDADSTINLTIEDGTKLDQFTGNINTLTLKNGATLSSDDSNGGLLLNGADITVTTDLLTLSDSTLIDYNNDALFLTGTLAIGNDILIDFSDATLEDNQAYTILDWSNADLTVTVNVESFTAKNLTPDMTGTFTIDGTQLTFHVTAIPEPSTWFLLGTGFGILLLTSRRRRNVQS